MYHLPKFLIKQITTGFKKARNDESINIYTFFIHFYKYTKRVLVMNTNVSLRHFIEHLLSICNFSTFHLISLDAICIKREVPDEHDALFLGKRAIISWVKIKASNFIQTNKNRVQR
ncbi:hypothetical protein Bca4012_025462 [Brassica carinata]